MTAMEILELGVDLNFPVRCPCSQIHFDPSMDGPGLGLPGTKSSKKCEENKALFLKKVTVWRVILHLLGVRI